MFVIACTIFCWPIVPAIGMAYGGYSTRHNGLASVYTGLVAISVCTLQWWLFGYTLSYGTGSAFIGDFEFIAHIGVWAQPSTTIPALIYSLFQLVFEATVAAIVVGGFVERGRILPIFPFVFVSSPRSKTIPVLSVLADNSTWIRSGPHSYTIHWPTWSGEAAFLNNSALSILQEELRSMSAVEPRQVQSASTSLGPCFAPKSLRTDNLRTSLFTGHTIPCASCWRLSSFGAVGWPLTVVPPSL